MARGFNSFGNSPTNYTDRHGTSPDVATAWMSTMWWLCGIDALLPLGDLLYIAGFAALLVLTATTLTSSTANTFQGDTSSLAADVVVSQNAVEAYASKKPVNLPSWKKLSVDMDHIASGHLPNGPRNRDGKKTVFWGLTIEQVYRAIREAYNNSSKLMTQGERILVEGYSEAYELVIQIWVNVVNEIIETAYPVGR